MLKVDSKRVWRLGGQRLTNDVAPHTIYQVELCATLACSCQKSQWEEALGQISSTEVTVHFLSRATPRGSKPYRLIEIRNSKFEIFQTKGRAYHVTGISPVNSSPSSGHDGQQCPCLESTLKCVMYIADPFSHVATQYPKPCLLLLPINAIRVLTLQANGLITPRSIAPTGQSQLWGVGQGDRGAKQLPQSSSLLLPAFSTASCNSYHIVRE